MVIYCTWFSRDCQELREIFGKEAAALAPFVECVDREKNFLVDDCPQVADLKIDKKTSLEARRSC